MQQHSELTLVILAAGLGTRFGGSKQLAEIEGLNRTIMELSIADAAPYIHKVVLVVNQQIKPLIELQIVPRLPGHLQVELAIQAISDVPERFTKLSVTRQKPWGTGHALLAARPFVSGKMIIITADDYYGPNAFKQLALYAQGSEDWAMLAYPIMHTLSNQGGVNRGICQLNTQGDLSQVDEYLDITLQDTTLSGMNPQQVRTELDVSALVSMTCWALNDDIFELLERNFNTFLLVADNAVKNEYYLPDQIQYALSHGLKKVNVLTAHDKWLGVTYRDELAAVSAQLENLFRDSVVNN